MLFTNTFSVSSFAYADKGNGSDAQTITVPDEVDYTINVGDTLKNVEIKAHEVVTMKLKVAKAGLVTIKATGMNLWLNFQKGKDGKASHHVSEKKKLTVGFKAKKGTYYLAFGALKDGKSGSFKLTVDGPKPDPTATPVPTEEPTPVPVEEAPVPAYAEDHAPEPQQLSGSVQLMGDVCMMPEELK